MISAFSSSTLSAASFFSNYWWSALSAPDSTAVDGFAIVIAQKWSLSNLRDAGWMPCPV